jgi:hypothetical protein
MKKQLNEELDRIKSIMGCCKGKGNATESFCGRDTVANPFNRILQLVFLDFRNLFSGWQVGDQDNYLWGCERWYRR